MFSPHSDLLPPQVSLHGVLFQLIFFHYATLHTIKLIQSLLKGKFVPTPPSGESGQRRRRLIVGAVPNESRNKDFSSGQNNG